MFESESCCYVWVRGGSHVHAIASCPTLRQLSKASSRFRSVQRGQRMLLHTLHRSCSGPGILAHVLRTTTRRKKHEHSKADRAQRHQVCSKRTSLVARTAYGPINTISLKREARYGVVNTRTSIHYMQRRPFEYGQSK